MKPTLNKLYYGELKVASVPNRTAEYRDSRDAAEKTRQRLQKECSPKLYERVQALLEEYDIMNSIDREEIFQQGFSLGVTLMVEALSGQ